MVVDTTPLARRCPLAGWMEERQQFGCSSPFILMRLQDGMPFWLPRGPRLWDGLIGARFIFVQLHDPCGLCLLAGQFNPSFFFRRLLVIGGDRSAFAFALGVSGVAPCARLLVAVARLMQDDSNRFFGNAGEPRLAQGSLQGRERPRRRLIFFAIWGTLHLPQDLYLLLAGVGELAPSS